MKRLLIVAVLLWSTYVLAQAPPTTPPGKIPNTGANNVWTGANDFRGPLTCNGVPCAGGAASDPKCKPDGNGNLQCETVTAGDATSSAKGTIEVTDAAGTVTQSIDGADGATFSKVAVGATVLTGDQQVDIKCSGNITTALASAISTLMAKNGGTVRLSSGSCYSTAQVLIPNDGATPPKQNPLIITGQGASMSGRGTAAKGGTILDLRWSGDYGKIQTSGLGLLSISHLTLTDTAGTSTPFVYTTNTALHIEHTAFIGSKDLTANDQDAIILGGTDEVEGGGGLTDGFQGYGTVIRDNYFNHIRRAVYGRTFANAVTVRDNTVWSQSGSNLAGGAAIEFANVASTPAQYDVGNNIKDNLIEVSGYPYGIKLSRSQGFQITGNGCYDPSTPSVACVYFASDAYFNTLIDGYTSAPSILPVEDNGLVGNNHIVQRYDLYHHYLGGKLWLNNIRLLDLTTAGGILYSAYNSDLIQATHFKTDGTNAGSDTGYLYSKKVYVGAEGGPFYFLSDADHLYFKTNNSFYFGDHAHIVSATGAVLSDGKGTFTGGVSTGTDGVTNAAVCWKDGTHIGYCSTVIGADGKCTCN